MKRWSAACGIIRRGTPAQMGLPTFLKFKRRQQVIKNILRTILDRVLQEAQRVERLSKNVDLTKAYEIILPEFDVEDNQTMGTGISYLMQGLTAAKSAGWISSETAMTLLFKFCDIEIDINEEQERIKDDQQEQQGTLTITLPKGQQPIARGADQTQQPAESPELAGKIKGNTVGGVGPGGW